MNISMKKLAVALAITSTLAVGTVANATTLTLAGSSLPYQNIGWSDTGIQITALQNVTLQSFTFANQGNNDTIELTDTSNNVLDSIGYIGVGPSSPTITVNWALAAGQTYDLISTNQTNSYWNYASFPVSNAQIQVNGGYGMGGLQSSYWFHFTNLTTSNSNVAAVPEPETYGMMLAGLGLMGFMARRKKSA